MACWGRRWQRCRLGPCLGGTSWGSPRTQPPPAYQPSRHRHRPALQVRELTRKYWLSYWRDPGYNFTRTLLSLLFAVIFGVIYYMAGSRKAALRVRARCLPALLCSALLWPAGWLPGWLAGWCCSCSAGCCALCPCRHARAACVLAALQAQPPIPRPRPAAAQVADVQNVLGILFSATQFLGMTNMMAIMPILGYERVVFYR